jgi:hypothetical protein
MFRTPSVSAGIAMLFLMPLLYGQFDPRAEINLPAGPSFRSVEEKDGYVYAVTSVRTLYIFDLRAVSREGAFASIDEPVGHIDEAGGSTLLRNGDFLYVLGYSPSYVADSHNGIKVYDISDASGPVFLRNVSAPGGIVNVFSDGERLYTSDDMVAVFSLADPSQPELIDSLPLDGWGGYSVAASGNTVYVSEYRSDPVSSRIRVIDASDLSSLSTVRLVDTENVAYHLAVVDGQLAAFESSKIRLYELADPTLPTEVDSQTASGRAAKAVCGYLLTNGRVFRIADRRLQLILSFNPGGHQNDGAPHGTAARDDFIYLTQKERILVLTTPPALVFPQYVSGQTGAVQNRTRVILRNAGSLGQEGSITFRDAAGAAQVVSIGGSPMESYLFTIAPWGTLDIVTDGQGGLLSGPVEVTSSLAGWGQLEGAEVFDVLGSSVSVPAAALGSRHQVYVSVDATEDTGVAVSNPDADQPVTLRFMLFDNEGTRRGTQLIELAPREQRAVYVTDASLFGDLLAETKSFRGTLSVISSDDRLVAVTGLIQKKSDGSLLAVPTGTRPAEP